jgi:hypothetical protein
LRTRNGTPITRDGDSENGIYVNATSGVQLGTFTADELPAATATSAFFLRSGTLNAKSLSGYLTQWGFTGDGGLVTAPIIVNQRSSLDPRAGTSTRSMRQPERNSGPRMSVARTILESATLVRGSPRGTACSWCRLGAR